MEDEANVVSFKDLNRIKRQKYKQRKKSKGKEIPKLEIDVPEIERSNLQISDEMDEYLKEVEDKFKPKVYEDTREERDEKEGDGQEEEDFELSNRQIRRYGRPTIATLKAVSRRPELIEPHDVNAPDPFTLVEIKNTRNVVPVPAHWAQKRRYLNYKRGSENSRYRLPTYLEKTGISQMRSALLELDEKKSQAQKQRERVRPKLNLFDMSSSILYDAFYKYQTKPELSRFGDLYFEGKETLPDSRAIKPGKLSARLKEALGMTENSPPPWLHKMQKIGPPPSYRSLKIPGLNAPIPKDAKWGHQPGGWGQVPVDSNRNPLWGGNPFAKATDIDESPHDSLWGQFQVSEGVADGVN